MLVAGGTQPPVAPPCDKSRGFSKTPLLSIQISKIYLSASPLPFPVSTLSVGRSGFCLLAQNKYRNEETVVLDSREKEDEDDYYVEEDEDFEEDDVNDDLNVIVPVEELDEWLERKPRGFGEEKVYDTSIEDGLLEEIEQTRRVQQANIAKLKSLSLEPQKQQRLGKDAEAVSSGVCVRISHLPKKRNIHRDLKAAFKGIFGVVNIMPVVFGSKKTKDPICKGLAFVYFNSLEDAKRFIDVFSVRNITFGKIDKLIKCEIVDSANNALPKTLNIPSVGGESKAGSVDESGLPLLDDSEKSSLDTDSRNEDDDIQESTKSLSASELDDADRVEQKMKSSVVSLQSKRGGTPHAAVKVKSAKKKEKKYAVANIPGAAKRLKLQEKAMLADVFSRYGPGVSSASKES